MASEVETYRATEKCQTEDKLMLYDTNAEFRESSRPTVWTTCLLLLAVAATSFFPACVTRVKDEANGSVPSGPELTEFFRLGNEAGGDSILFGGIGELVAVNDANQLFVGEQQDLKIYAFTTEGDLFKTIGQEGSGPGEFGRLGSIYIGPDDTLYVFDSRLDRMSAFDPDELDLAYVFPIDRDSLGMPSRLVGVIDTGFLVTFGWPITPWEETAAERRLYVVRVDWTGQILPPPVHYLPAAEWLVSKVGNDPFAIGMSFGRDPVLRMGPGGKLFSGWTESVNIAVISAEGAQSNTVTHALTRQEIERYADGRADWFRQAVLAADLPATKPAFETFVVDDRDRIWIKITPPSVADTTAQWLVLDTNSRLLGQLHLPVTVNLRIIRSDRAYAVSRGKATALIVYQIRE